jgi:hypothetical protein
LGAVVSEREAFALGVLAVAFGFVLGALLTL